MQIQVKNISKQYAGQVAVNGISFTLNKGEITGFLGPNGAGKTTTMKMLTGAITPWQGSIFINDIPFETNKLHFQKKIGYLPEHNPLYLEMYVREYLAFCADIYKVSHKKIQEIINLTGLEKEAHKKIQELSKGYRQRVGLAAALLHNPEILILDEPTTGLDPNQILEIRQIIRQLAKDKIVLISSHILQEIEAICHRVIILHKGEIVLNTPLQALQNELQTIEVMFDYRIETPFFKKIPHLKEVQNQYDAFYTLTFNTQTDMRSAIFDFATENGLKILQINHKHNSLETIFSKYTHSSE